MATPQPSLAPRSGGSDGGLRTVVAILVGALLLALCAALPAAAEAQEQSRTWQSSQFGMGLAFPSTWSVAEEQSDPIRGDVVILGNDVSALLVGLLHDTRSPRQMMLDLVQSQKEATPDLAVIQSTESATGSMLLFLQYTVHPQASAAVLIDEKALLGTLKAGQSTVTIRGMVPDHADVEAEFETIDAIIASLTPAP